MASLIDGEIRTPSKKTFLKIASGVNYCLAEDEVLQACPYDMAHQVMSSRYVIHLTKCRRNYEKLCESLKEPAQIVCCKYNWSHHVLLPEIVHHEKNCDDQYSFVKYMMEISELDPNNPGEFIKKFEVYKTKGLSRVSATSGPMKMERPSSVKQGSNGDKSGVSLMPSLVMQMRLHSARKGSSIMVESVTKAHNLGSDLTDLEASSPRSMLTTERAPPKPDIVPGVVPFNTGRRAVGGDDDEEWAGSGVVYDSMKKNGNEIILKYPPFLTKSERKAWVRENEKKSLTLYGGRLLNIEPAEPTPKPI